MIRFINYLRKLFRKEEYKITLLDYEMFGQEWLTDREYRRKVKKDNEKATKGLI